MVHGGYAPISRLRQQERCVGASYIRSIPRRDLRLSAGCGACVCRRAELRSLYTLLLREFATTRTEPRAASVVRLQPHTPMRAPNTVPVATCSAGSRDLVESRVRRARATRSSRSFSCATVTYHFRSSHSTRSLIAPLRLSIQCAPACLPGPGARAEILGTWARLEGLIGTRS